MVAVLLHLGNVAFDDDAAGLARAAEGEAAVSLQRAASVLMEPALEALITHRSMSVRGERMRIDLRAEQAEQSLQGLLKSLYSLGFSWVVKRINQAMHLGAAAPSGTVHLDMLDIFGFENFTVNSFEQLCINFANEKLHQLFLHAMFKAEQEVIALERVDIPPVDFCDNTGCLALLELPPHGIFQLLDTACRVNTAPANFCLQARSNRSHEMHAAS